MTELIINWLKTFPYLSEKIATTNLEDLFSNGYYFAKIFYSNKVFLDMKLIKNTEEKDDAYQNYFFLGKTFRNLGIDLMEEDINELINKKLHKAELYLFRIKQSLLLNKIQFNEIIEKMKAESKLKLKDEIELMNKNKKKSNRYQSATKRSEPETKEKKQSRLQSAKLPNISNIPKKIKNRLNNMMDNRAILKEENEKIEIKQMQAVINDINIFENIHMKKKGQKINKRNPWDEISYISDKDDLFNKNKIKEKKYAIFDLLKTENKKDNADTNIKAKIKEENKIAKIKSNLNNYSQFMADNKKQYLNKTHLEKGLSLMGLKTMHMFPSILNIKGEKIPSEIIMKSINGKNKNKNNDYKSFTTGFDYEYTKKEKEEKIRAPISAKRIHSNIKLTKTYIKKDKDKESNTKRPLTSKYPNLKIEKSQTKPKESDKAVDNLNIKDQSKETKKSRDKKRDYRNKLAKIEETGNIPSQNQNSIPSSIVSNVKIEDEEYNKIKYQKENNITPPKIKKIKTLTEEEKIKQIEQKKREYYYDTKNIQEIISSIIDITEVYFDYQHSTKSEFIDLEQWNKITYKFIHNISIIKRKKVTKVISEEEKGNLNFNFYGKIDDNYLNNFNENEKNEFKNYLYNIGKKYDRNKNNLFVKKLGIKPVTLEINDIMGDEIDLLFKKALAEGKDVRDDEDEDEIKKTGVVKYRPSREEEELLSQKFGVNATIPEYHFTNLISEIIKFVFEQEKNKEITKEKEIKESNNNIKEENKNKVNNDIKEENVSFKEILNSIPIKMSFIGLMNNEIKLILKTCLNKYPKLKIYNPIEFLNNLRFKKNKIDEPIDEINLKKNQIDQLKKEKNIFTEEIKDYLYILENKNNLSDDELCMVILQNCIKKDFEKKNLDDIKQEIITKRENLNALNEKINTLKEEQTQGKKINPREIDNLQQQIDKIFFESITGFVIINYPNNINQSKLMEKYLMNFIQPCEQGISDFDIINDKLLFICDKETKYQKLVKFEPCLEKLVLLYCSNDKLIKEENVNNNMTTMDHITKYNNQTIDEGEGFNKEQIEEYKNNFKEMEEFYQNFNIKIDKYDYYEGIEEENIVILNNNNINMNSNGFTQRDKTIYEKLKSSLMIYEDKLVPRIVNKMVLADESYDEFLEDVIQIKDKDSSRKISGDSLIKPTSNNKTSQKKDSLNSSTLKNNEISKISPEKERVTTQKNQITKPKVISLINLSEEEKYIIYNTWKDFIEQYNYYIFRIFYRERNLKRRKIEEELFDIQNNFIQFLVSPEEQNILVNQFIEKYRCFKDNFCKNKAINKESNKLIIRNFKKDIDELSESLWNVAKIRKNQASIEIEKMERDRSINKDLGICYFKLERLILLETQKLIVIINLFVRYLSISFNPKFISSNNNIIPQFSLDDLTLSEELLQYLDKEELAKQVNNKTVIYPRANRLYKNTYRLLIKINIFLDDFYNKISIKDKKGNIVSQTSKSLKKKKTMTKGGISSQNSLSSTRQVNTTTKIEMQNQIRFAIKSHIKKYKNRIYNLYMNTLEDLSKIYCPFNQIIKLMDDWIILSMELQTNNIDKIIKRLDLTNNYQIGNNTDNEKIEKDIVDSIISDYNEIYNFKFEGIDPDRFALYEESEYLGVYDTSKKENELTNDDFYKIHEFIKEYDIITKLRNLEIQKGIIPSDKFEEIVFKNGLFDNIYRFPTIFKSLDYHNISKFLSHFTFYSSDFNNDINTNEHIHAQKLLYTNDILSILILSCIAIDKEKIEEKYNMIENSYINEEKFMENNFGFEDGLNYINDKENKIRQIKRILFNINKTCNEIPEINIKKFLNLLLLKPLKDLNSEIRIVKYFDLFYN